MPKIVDREEMQRGILEAALQVFTELGYHAATIAQVAESARLGKGTLYLYFKNKEAIAEALVDRELSRMEDRFLIEEWPDDVDGFIAVLDRSMNVPDEYGEYLRMFFEVLGPSLASDTVAKTVSGFFEKLGAHYAQSLAHLQARGAIRSEVNPKVLGRALASLVDGMVLHRALFGVSKARYSRMRRDMLETVARGIVAT